MSDLGSRVRRVIDPVEPVGLEEVQAASLRRNRRHHRRRVGALGAGVALVVVLVVAVAVSRENSTTVRVSTTPGRARLSSTGGNSRLSVTLQLSAASVPDGSRLTGLIVVENNTGAAIHDTGCVDFFDADLETRSAAFAPAPRALPMLTCIQQLTVPAGKSVYPIQIDTSTLNCIQTSACTPGQGLVPRPGETSWVRVYPLFAGLPAPPPIPVEVTAVDAPHATIVGTLQAFGGPAGVAPRPLPGQITATGNANTYTAAAGQNGEFSLSVPAGTYTIIGHSPLYQDGNRPCQADGPVTIAPAGYATTDVNCQER